MAAIFEPGSSSRAIGAKPHGSSKIAFGGTVFQLIAAHPFRHQTDDRLFHRPEFAGIGACHAGQGADSLDHRHLHSETDAEIRNVVFPREFGGEDLAFGPSLAKAARNQNAMNIFQEGDRIARFRKFPIRSSRA